MIINAPAYTAVEAAETQQAEAQATNAVSPGVFAEEASKIGGAVVHYSTDYVFDGSKTTPYDETDSPAPIKVGKTKLAGEQAIRNSRVPHLILRSFEFPCRSTLWHQIARLAHPTTACLRSRTHRPRDRPSHLISPTHNHLYISTHGAHLAG